MFWSNINYNNWKQIISDKIFFQQKPRFWYLYFEKIKFWKNSDELLNNYKYIILKRDNNISSSKVRDKVKNIEDVSQFICKDVEHYILENKLYK